MMDWLTLTWSMAASACLTLALISLCIWVKDRRNYVHLLFCIAAAAVAGLAVCELLMMFSQTPEQFARRLRWAHVPVAIAVITVVWFVYVYLRAGRLWLAWATSACRVLVLVLNFTFAPNLNYSQITGLRHVSILGEAKAAVPVGVVSQRTRIGELNSLLLLAFVIDAAITAWRRGNAPERRRAIVIGGGVACFVLIGAGHTALVHTGIIRSPYMISLAFLVPIAAMGSRLGDDVVHAAQLSRELIRNRAELLENERRLELAATERRSLERERSRQRDELAHLSRIAMLGELSGALAHELNQPLTAILSNAQAAQEFLSQDSTDLDEVRGILEDIVQEDRRAREVIRRLRVLFRKGQVQFEPLDLNELVNEVIQLMNADLVNHGVTVQAQLSPGLPVIRGDRVQLQQVLINLIVNATDAMADCEADSRRLRVSTDLEGDRTVLMSVADSGCGIPAEDLERIFQPFHTTKTNGMGLGLAVCRTIMSAHAGRLWASNNLDRGACFQVAFAANGEP